MPQAEIDKAVDTLIDAMQRDDEAAGMAAIKQVLKTLLGDLRRLTAAVEKLAERAP